MTSSTQGGIFISYRRDDASGHAGRLHDHLVNRFGADRVFIDVESIEAGHDFVTALDAALAGCRAVIAVIGPRWLTAVDAGGRRRLDSPDDFVRLEIEAALAVGTRLIPVLVQDAKMPAEAQLPESLAALSRHQAYELTDRHWRADVGALLTLLDRVAAPADTGPTDAGRVSAPSSDAPPTHPPALLAAARAQPEAG
jgi:hypothetical protein